MFFGHKNKPQSELQVDLGDLQNEKENLASFLQLHLKVSVSQVENKLTVDSEKVSLKDLEHVVNKFVYHRDLNNTHWVSVEGASTVKINHFFKGSNRKTKASGFSAQFLIINLSLVNQDQVWKWKHGTLHMGLI